MLKMSLKLKRRHSLEGSTMKRLKLCPAKALSSDKRVGIDITTRSPAISEKVQQRIMPFLSHSLSCTKVEGRNVLRIRWNGQAGALRQEKRPDVFSKRERSSSPFWGDEQPPLTHATNGKSISQEIVNNLWCTQVGVDKTADGVARLGLEELRPDDDNGNAAAPSLPNRRSFPYSKADIQLGTGTGRCSPVPDMGTKQLMESCGAQDLIGSMYDSLLSLDPTGCLDCADGTVDDDCGELMMMECEGLQQGGAMELEPTSVFGGCSQASTNSLATEESGFDQTEMSMLRMLMC